MLIVEQTVAVTLPAAQVRMMVVQPFLDLQEPLREPFPLRDACAARLMDAINSVFAKVTEHRPHMVLFPEFALPGVQGVERVADALSSGGVASPTIVIGGVSGLTDEAFDELCALPSVAEIDPVNAPPQVQHTQWINVSVTFVKDDQGIVRLWLQPKLSPSWPEANCHHQEMFRGGLVRIFRARFDNHVPCRFLSFLCFDWVGHENGVQIPEAVLQQFHAMCETAGSPQDLHWVFVLQHNPAPNHATFLTATHRFLTETTAPFVRRRDAAVVMVSTASSQQPAQRRPDKYGYSSIAFGSQAPFDSNGCWPTFATQSSRLRQSDVLGTCKDVVFREMGECIHLADVRVPNFVVLDPTDHTAALVQARALPLVGAVVDPRIPNDLVPAVVKWTNDELDAVPDFCTTYFTGSPIEPALREAQVEMVDRYRHLRSQDLALRIDRACATRVIENSGTTDPASDVDIAWDTDERRGLRHVIQSLTLVRGAVDVDPVNSQLHARCGQGIEIAAIAGTTHTDCVTALRKLAERTHAPILFVSRDDENTICLPREAESFADPREGSGVRFTDAQTLLTVALTKPLNKYQEFVAELVNVQDRRII